MCMKAEEFSLAVSLGCWTPIQTEMLSRHFDMWVWLGTDIRITIAKASLLYILLTLLLIILGLFNLFFRVYILSYYLNIAFFFF